jgi:hypothetical protein
VGPKNLSRIVICRPWQQVITRLELSVGTYIWLFASATGVRQSIKHYPMLVPGSRDYGTVNLKDTHRGCKFSIMTYPRLVHVIKSFDSHQQGDIRKHSEERSTGGRGAEDDPQPDGSGHLGLGGLQIELTIASRTLKDVLGLVEETPFLDTAYRLHMGKVRIRPAGSVRRTSSIRGLPCKKAPTEPRHRHQVNQRQHSGLAVRSEAADISWVKLASCSG